MSFKFIDNIEEKLNYKWAKQELSKIHVKHEDEIQILIITNRLFGCAGALYD